VAVDINHDSHLDLIAGGNGTLYVYLGDGHGAFTQQSFTNQGSSDAFFGVVAGDFNNDSKVDFLAAAFNGNSLRYFPGNGDGSFGAPSTQTSQNIFSPDVITSADFNGDSKRDLLVGSSNIATVIFGNGDGTFQIDDSQVYFLPIPRALPGPVTNSPPIVAAADMDADGKIDAVTADSFSNTVNVFLNDGTGKFPQSVPDFTFSVFAGSNQLQLTDLNGDGLPDIIVTNYITQDISIFLSSKRLPDITVSPSSPFALAGSPISVTVKVAGSSLIVPTGPVTLMDDSTSLGQQNLDTSGQAIFTLTNLAAGYHTFSAVYAGDTNYYGQTSILVGQAMLDMQIASKTPSQTVAAGATASYSLTVTPAGGLNGTITLTCSQLPSLATCDPVTVTIFDKPVSATLSVKTIAPVRSQNSNPHYAFALLPLFAVCCVRRRRLLTPLLGITLICTLGFFATGCSSSKSSTSTPGTPSGSSTFTITASTIFGGQTLTRTTTATLVVQ
jgi:hypothetical protein